METIERFLKDKKGLSSWGNYFKAGKPITMNNITEIANKVHESSGLI